MKKLLASLLSLMLVAGCSANVKVTTTTNETTSSVEAAVETTAEPEASEEATASPTAEADEDKAAYYAAYPDDAYKAVESAVVKLNDPTSGTSIIIGTMPDGTAMLQLIAEGLDFQSYTTTEGKIYIHFAYDGEDELTGWCQLTDEETDEDEEELEDNVEVEVETTTSSLGTLTYVETVGDLDHCTYEDEGTTYSAYFESDGDHRLVRLEFPDEDLQIDYIYDGLSIGEDLLNSEEITEDKVNELLEKAYNALGGDELFAMFSGEEE